MRTTEDELIRVLCSTTPPTDVTQEQFDNCYDALVTIATPGAEPTESDWIQYCYDLHYTALQEDLFRWAFPRLMAVWRKHVLSGQHTSLLVSFDAAIASPRRNGTWLLDEMMTPRDRDVVYQFACRTMLDRLDMESSLRHEGFRDAAWQWLEEFVVLGCWVPRIREFWSEWWQFKTLGHAIAALQYASCLVCSDDANPVFGTWSPTKGAGPPCLWEKGEMGTEQRWLELNVNELSRLLNVPALHEAMGCAALLLRDHPDGERARKVQDDLRKRSAIVEERIPILLRKLADPNADHGWM